MCSPVQFLPTHEGSGVNGILSQGLVVGCCYYFTEINNKH